MVPGRRRDSLPPHAGFRQPRRSHGRGQAARICLRPARPVQYRGRRPSPVRSEHRHQRLLRLDPPPGAQRAVRLAPRPSARRVVAARRDRHPAARHQLGPARQHHRLQLVARRDRFGAEQPRREQRDPRHRLRLRRRRGRAGPRVRPGDHPQHDLQRRPRRHQDRPRLRHPRHLQRHPRRDAPDHRRRRHLHLRHRRPRRRVRLQRDLQRPGRGLWRGGRVPGQLQLQPPRPPQRRVERRPRPEDEPHQPLQPDLQQHAGRRRLQRGHEQERRHARLGVPQQHLHQDGADRSGGHAQEQPVAGQRPAVRGP